MLLDASCVLFQKLYADYVFFYKLNVDYIFYQTVTGELTSTSSSLLWTLERWVDDVSIGIRSHSSDGRLLPIATELPL
jgi:hypothetical protein